MKILFISPWFPFPPDNGIKIRIYNLLRILGQRHEITLVAFQRQGDTVLHNGLDAICRSIQIVPWCDYNPTRPRALAGFLSPTPRSLRDTFSPEMDQRVRDLCTNESFDVVIASTIDTATYALSARARVRVLEEHNFTTQWMREQFQSQKTLLRRARYWLTFAKYRRYEARLYAHFDACTMVSVHDALAVAHLMGVHPPIRVIPNGVDWGYYTQREFTPEPNTLVFNGSLTYYANLDAMRYFLGAIWQTIKTQAPAAQLKITGRTNGVALEQLPAGADVTFTGYLADIRPTVGTSWVCVVPLRTGSGTRLKILEAMALGTPVVSTAKGAEGLDVTHEKDILIADQPDEFAGCVERVLNDASLRTRLATHARRLVETEYDWKISGSRFEALLQELVERRQTCSEK